MRNFVALTTVQEKSMWNLFKRRQFFSNDYSQMSCIREEEEKCVVNNIQIQHLKKKTSRLYY